MARERARVPERDESRLDKLTRELGAVIRLAAKEADSLEGQVPVLAGFHLVTAAAPPAEDLVHFITRRMVPAYLERLPASGQDPNAIRALFEYEDDTGTAQSLQTRYHKASAHFPTPPTHFARRQEPRLLRMCARHFIALDHEDSIEAALHAGADLDVRFHPIAQRLWDRALELHHERVTAIQEGAVELRDQDELLEVLVEFTYGATESLQAVDQTSLERWFSDSRLRRYLTAQLRQAESGEVAVERIRIVREADLARPRERNLLREFVELHERAGARLHVIHEDDARGLNTVFLRGKRDDRTIVVLIDPDSKPAGVISELDDDGYVERTTCFLRSANELRRCQRDFRVLTESLEREAHQDVRARLDAVDDPPVTETPASEEASPRWPLGPSSL